MVLYMWFSLTGYSQTFPGYNLTVYDSSLSGYYFLSTSKLGVIQFNYIPKQLVLDAKGEVVYYRPFLTPAGSLDFKVQPNGKISYYKAGSFYILDSTFTVVDTINCSGYYTDPHDLQIINNNHYLLLGEEAIMMNLSSYHYFNHNGSAGSPNATVTGSIIQELDSAKNILFEWHTLSHFQFDDVDEFWLNSPVNVDWTHCNAVELDTDGNILLSTRHFNEVTKIDRSTGNIIWRMGGKENEFTFYNDSLIFRGQHDIRRIANGNLTLYDDGNYTVPHGARGVEYAVDELNKTATLVWSYTHDPNLVSYATGNNQRVIGSRKLINYGNRSYGDLGFSFIDSLNNPISEMTFSDSSASYRVFFYPTLPWSFHRPQLSCYLQGSNYYLATSSPYNSYSWSTGETTASIQITAPGTYYVFVPYGEGFISSESFEIVNINNPCSATSINEQVVHGSTISLYPNPAGSFVVINYSLPNEQSYELKITDLTGKEVFKTLLQSVGTYTLDTRNFENGIYFIRIGNYSKKFIKSDF